METSHSSICILISASTILHPVCFLLNGSYDSSGYLFLLDLVLFLNMLSSKIELHYHPSLSSLHPLIVTFPQSCPMFPLLSSWYYYCMHYVVYKHDRGWNLVCCFYSKPASAMSVTISDC